MIIQTLNERYEIVQKISDDQTKSILIARKESALADDLCMMVMLKGQEQVYSFIPFCTELKENLLFVDFLNFFPKNGRLYMVFPYKQYPTLKACLLETNISLKNRLTIARNILQKIVFLNLPLYFQYEVLSDENLVLVDSCQIVFNYNLEDPRYLQIIKQEQVYHRLQQIFERLFRIEIEDQSCSDLEDFINKIKNNEEILPIQLSRAFEPVYENLIILDEEKKIKPKKVLFRVWERSKQIFKYIKIIFILLIMLALLGYLVVTIQSPVIRSGDEINYQQIGDLEIKNE